MLEETCVVCGQEATELFADEGYCSQHMLGLVNEGEAQEDSLKEETNEY